MFSNIHHHAQDTIYAPASSPQKSGLIVVRISGPGVTGVINKLNCTVKKPRYANLTYLHDPITKALIDQSIVIFYQAPHSFTGEDVLEINLHGSRAVLRATLDALSKIDKLRLAEPGEFSMRGFFNNKMDLTQIEGLADLIEAETDAQRLQALKQMTGSLKEIYGEWRQKLIQIISRVEAHIDFPDEGLPDSILNDVKMPIKELVKEILMHLEDDKRGEKLRDGLYVTILGPTNAGKSSIMNRIVKRDVAIVSQIEGTTRDVIEANLNINGYPVTIADTAGIRESADVLENEGIKRSIERAQSADLKVIILDATKDTKEHMKILDLADGDTILVFNKTDLISFDLSAASQSVRKICKKITRAPLAVSAKENKGIEEIIKQISNFTEKFFTNPSASPLITRQRYRENLAKCCETLLSIDLDSDIVFAAEDLRFAANCLGRITGEIDVESILGEIFSSFCIGK